MFFPQSEINFLMKVLDINAQCGSTGYELWSELSFSQHCKKSYGENFLFHLPVTQKPSPKLHQNKHEHVNVVMWKQELSFPKSLYKVENRTAVKNRIIIIFVDSFLY